MNLQELVQQESELLSQLKENRAKQEELSSLIFTERYGINIGDTVEWEEGSVVKNGIISGIEFSCHKAIRYRAKPFNKNGEVNKRETIIWSFPDTIRLVSKKID